MPDSKTDYQELISKYREYSILSTVSGLLQWDQQTIMPHKGSARRADQLDRGATAITQDKIQSEGSCFFITHQAAGNKAYGIERIGVAQRR